MADQFTLEMTIQAKPELVIQTWLDSQVHSAITGGNYQIEPMAGGKFSAWDGYITGTFNTIDTPYRINMSWRASEFPEDSPDSTVDLSFEPIGNDTLVVLMHSNIPDGLGARYQEGWFDFYLQPLVKYYSKQNEQEKK